jgi:hypothetical protein
MNDICHDLKDRIVFVIRQTVVVDGEVSVI